MGYSKINVNIKLESRWKSCTTDDFEPTATFARLLGLVVDGSQMFSTTMTRQSHATGAGQQITHNIFRYELQRLSVSVKN